MRRLVAAALALGLATLGCAHDLSVSLTRVSVGPDQVEVRLNMAAETAWAATERVVAPGVAFVAETFATEAKPHLLTWARRMVSVSVDGARLEPARVDVVPIEDHFEFAWDFRRPSAGGLLTFEERYLPGMPAGYLTKIEVCDEAGEVMVATVLDAGTTSIEITLGPSGSGPAQATEVIAPPATFGRFLWLGVEHILIGFDHLLFLAGLLVVCRRASTALVIISSFTVAHSLTLALAALDLVALPPRLVEAVIAASIVYVGLENLIRRREPKGRVLLTLGFGLIHGFGFAGVLKELGLGADGSGWVGPLVAFNLGVELGQVAVAAVVLPLIWWAQRSTAYDRRTLPVVSGLIAAAGAYWLIERIFA